MPTLLPDAVTCGRGALGSSIASASLAGPLETGVTIGAFPSANPGQHASGQLQLYPEASSCRATIRISSFCWLIMHVCSRCNCAALQRGSAYRVGAWRACALPQRQQTQHCSSKPQGTNAVADAEIRCGPRLAPNNRCCAVVAAAEHAVMSVRDATYPSEWKMAAESA